MNKLSRNDPCHCASNKKYKNCCLIGDIKSRNSSSFPGQSEPSTEKTTDVMLTLNQYYPDYETIDVSTVLKNEHIYQDYQQNYMRLYNATGKKVFMVCERNEVNDALFEKRLRGYPGDESDMNFMILYYGSYRFIDGYEAGRYMQSLSSMFPKN